MPYGVYYPGCDEEWVDHFCSTCGGREGARVRATAFIRKDYYATATDLTNPIWWRTGIANKKIVVLPRTNGNFDGGAEVEGPGFGDEETELLGYNFTAVFNDPNYAENGDFWNSVKRSRDWVFVYKTESLIHSSEVGVSIIPKNPVEDATTSNVYWNVTVKWANEDLPEPLPEPAGIFTTCVDYTGTIV